MKTVPKMMLQFVIQTHVKLAKITQIVLINPKISVPQMMYVLMIVMKMTNVVTQKFVLEELVLNAEMLPNAQTQLPQNVLEILAGIALIMMTVLIIAISLIKLFVILTQELVLFV